MNIGISGILEFGIRRPTALCHNGKCLFSGINRGRYMYLPSLNLQVSLWSNKLRPIVGWIYPPLLWQDRLNDLLVLPRKGPTLRGVVKI